jgi:hypothetical protein
MHFDSGGEFINKNLNKFLKSKNITTIKVVVVHHSNFA